MSHSIDNNTSIDKQSLLHSDAPSSTTLPGNLGGLAVVVVDSSNTSSQASAPPIETMLPDMTNNSRPSHQVDIPLSPHVSAGTPTLENNHAQKMLLFCNKELSFANSIPSPSVETGYASCISYNQAQKQAAQNHYQNYGPCRKFFPQAIEAFTNALNSENKDVSSLYGKAGSSYMHAGGYVWRSHLDGSGGTVPVLEKESVNTNIRSMASTVARYYEQAAEELKRNPSNKASAAIFQEVAHQYSRAIQSQNKALEADSECYPTQKETLKEMLCPEATLRKTAGDKFLALAIFYQGHGEQADTNPSLKSDLDALTKSATQARKKAEAFYESSCIIS